MVELIGQTSPKARKEHRCDMCSRTIRIGEVYARQRVVWEYGPGVWRECQHCQTALGTLSCLREEADLDDGGVPGPDSLIDYEPKTWAEARWKAMWRRKWTRRDGTLHPVPGAHGGGA